MRSNTILSYYNIYWGSVGREGWRGNGAPSRRSPLRPPSLWRRTAPQSKRGSGTGRVPDPRRVVPGPRHHGRWRYTQTSFFPLTYSRGAGRVGKDGEATTPRPSSLLLRPPSTPDPISLVLSHWSRHSARDRVPDPRRIVPGARRHPPPVRRPSHAVDIISVPLERADDF